MLVKSIAECIKGSILQYSWPSLSYIFVLSIFEWPFYTDFTVFTYSHENKQGVSSVATLFQIVTVINSMHAVHFFMIFLSSAFFQNQVFRKNLSGILSWCQAWPESKLFAKVISRRHNSPLAGKELKVSSRGSNFSDINLRAIPYMFLYKQPLPFSHLTVFAVFKREKGKGCL